MTMKLLKKALCTAAFAGVPVVGAVGTGAADVLESDNITKARSIEGQCHLLINSLLFVWICASNATYACACTLALADVAPCCPARQVYIVFSNHFDEGYTLNVNGSCAGAVVNQYFHEHFPKAISTGKAARAAGHFQYRWMTQSWLVSAFRTCAATKININGPAYPSDLVCPNATAMADFEEAVRVGDITWHAFPFNSEPETFNSIELLNAAFNLTFAEDAHFGHARRRTLSQRDVPGACVRACAPAEMRACAPAEMRA